MSKEIQLTKGKIAIVDDDVYEELVRSKWYYASDGYAARNVYLTGHAFMHRVIMNAPKGMQVDHINGNKLDNRRCNLRLATMSQNQHNRGAQKNNKFGYKGVYTHKKTGKWRAFIKLDGEKMYLGLFETPQAAAIAYNEAALKYHGEFARLNEI